MSPAESMALVYGGVQIREDGERLNLTDFWKAGGSPKNVRPNDWMVLSSTKRLLRHFELEMNQGGIAPLVKTSKGVPGERGGSTWAHWKVAIAYAEDLSPSFHSWCIDVVSAHMRGEPIGASLAKASQITGLDTTTFEALIAKVVTPLFERVDALAAIVERHAEHPERFASFARVGDQNAAQKLRARIGRVAEAHHTTFARVEGIVRREYAVPGYLKLATRLVSDVEGRLDDLFLAKELPPSSRKRKAPVATADPRQRTIFNLLDEKAKRARKKREPMDPTGGSNGGNHGPH